MLQKHLLHINLHFAHKSILSPHSYNLIQTMLHTQNMPAYFKLTIIAILHCTHFNHIYLKIPTLWLILSVLTRKDFVLLFFSKLFPQFKEMKFINLLIGFLFIYFLLYLHTYIRGNRHKFISIHIYTYTHTCSYVHMRRYILTYVPQLLSLLTYIYIYILTQKYIHIYIHIIMRPYANAYTYT